MKKDGYVYINESIRFKKSIEFFDNWRNDYYVDPTNGDDTNAGTSTFSHLKNLATALTKSIAGDVIYIRPKVPDTTGGDPTAITPATAANWSIPYAKHGVSIIGTGPGRAPAGAQMTLLQGHASVTSSPVLDIAAPYCNIENLGFKRGGSTVGQVMSKTDASTRFAFATTFYKCWFRLGQSVGALITDAAWYDQIIKCTFSGCSVGILIGAGNSVPVGILIDGCDFEALAADVTADIKTSGAVTRILMKNLTFNHAVPSGGSPNKYVSVAAASTGLIANCFTGAADPTVADNMTLNSILYSNIWGDGVGPFVDA